MLQAKRPKGQDSSPEANCKRATADPSLSTQDNKTMQLSKTNRKGPRPLLSRITQQPNQGNSSKRLLKT
ncbi:hypothetical protein PCASD_20615 [Puccinia coronata f. sp. avenae]|uniref:Uncharacterized protein n=1 Tax=Puccinia coronata f. sp. avenae TaxID=200324 RepID=A0A2N5U193_9BASI|nr:hypothetical protein PCASD_20615 [Puccinia coronata f. sp. avenae]